jgi:Pyruvate/2-oxoacid:ferredoxin oxidoreductase delta subunit
MRRRYARVVACSITFAVVFVALGSVIQSDEKKATDPDPKWKVTKPDLSDDEMMEADNSYCLVCHINLEDEELVQIHNPYGIGCELCHGMSIKHSADEDNLTPPDIMWSRWRINSRCLTCHDRESIDKEEKAAKAHKKMFSDMAKPDADLNKIRYCTKCHGKHRIKNRTRVWDRETGEVVEQSGGPTMDRG